MTDKTTASLFTGGGGFEIGAMMAGYRPVWGVEIRPDIAAVAERNIPGLRMIVSDVADVGYSALPEVDHLHASPSCKNASQASNGEEAPEDLSSAMAICRALREVNPAAFTLENVWQYREFESFKMVVGQLTRLGYKVDWWHLNSADYGVPQTRKRLILIARKDHQPRRPQPTHSKTPDPWGVYKPWVGWLEAIVDLVDTLPGSEFAPWQLERLPAELKSMLLAQGGYEGGIVNRSIKEPSFTVTSNSNQAGVRAFLAPVNGEESAGFYGDEPAQTIAANHSANKYRALLVDQINHRGDDGQSTIREEKEPVWTIPVYSPKHPTPRAFLGRIVKMTPRALARFQSFPDDYVLPETLTVWTSLDPSNGLACEVIGNAVAPLLAKAICDSLK